MATNDFTARYLERKKQEGVGKAPLPLPTVARERLRDGLAGALPKVAPIQAEAPVSVPMGTRRVPEAAPHGGGLPLPGTGWRPAQTTQSGRRPDSAPPRDAEGDGGALARVAALGEELKDPVRLRSRGMLGRSTGEIKAELEETRKSMALARALELSAAVWSGHRTGASGPTERQPYGRGMLPAPGGVDERDATRRESLQARQVQERGVEGVLRQEAIQQNRQGLLDILAGEQAALDARKQTEDALSALKQAETRRWRSRDPRDEALEGSLKTGAQAAEEARRGVQRVNYVKDHLGKTFEDNFGGQFLASFEMGRMSQDEAKAWSRYLAQPTEENRAYAQAIGALRTSGALRNADALDGEATLPLISQSLAGYLPQFLDQQAAGLKGGLSGAAMGTMAAGPAGTVTGAKVGYAAGRANEGFEVMQGAAFKTLLEAGVPEAVARQAAKDEGFVSSLIELADAGVDIATLGWGGLLRALGKETGKQTAKAAGKTFLQTAGRVLGGYALNVLGEGAQEAVQEGVSIANQRRAQEWKTGQFDLAGRALGVVGDAITGRDPESAAQMAQAGVEGMKIAAMVGGATLAGNTAVSHGLTTGREASVNTSIDNAYGAMLENGMFSPEARAAAQRADARLGARPAGGLYRGEEYAGAETRADDIRPYGDRRESGVQASSGSESLGLGGFTPTKSNQMEGVPARGAAPGGEGQQKTASTGEAAVGLIPLSELERSRLATGKKNIVADTVNDIVVFVKNALAKKGGTERLYMGKMPEQTVSMVSAATGMNISDYTAVLPGDSVQHIFKHHGNEATESSRGQRAVTAEDLSLIPKVLAEPDSVQRSEENDVLGRPVLMFSKQIGDTYITAQAVTDGRQVLTTSSMWIQKKKNRQDTTHNADVSISPVPNARSVPPQGSSLDTRIAPGDSGVKGQFAQEGGEHTAREDTYIGTPATDKLGIKIVRPITDLGASQSLRGMKKARYQAERALNQLLKDSGATEAYRKFSQGVADGTFRIEQTPPGMHRALVREIADAIVLRDSFHQKAIAEKKARNNWAYDARVETLIKRSDDKKSPGMLSLNLNTMQRNNERIWGADAEAINAEIFDPVVQNEAERNRFANRMLAQLEQYKLNADESGQVQRLMEGEVTETQLKAGGYDAGRLAEAAKTLSGLYADFYDAINDFLVAHGYEEIGFQKNYAPHRQPENMDRLQGYLARLGFQMGVNELPTDLAGRTESFKPGKQYDPYFQHRRGGKKIDDAVGGFESYVNYLSNVLYHTDDIQKLRRLGEALRKKYGSEELSAEIDRLNMLEDRLAEGGDGLNRGDIQAAKDEAYARLGNMSKFGGYVSVLDNYINILAGKQTVTDRGPEGTWGRRMLNLGRSIQSAFSQAVILGNLSTAINQTVQVPQLIAEVGPKYTAKAVMDVATGETARANLVQESDFLTGKRGIKSIAQKTGRETVFNIAAKPFEIVDDFASGVIVRAKYLEQIAAGKEHTEALRVADQFATRLVGSRMKGAKPVLFEAKNPLYRLVTTFQLEVLNGWEHMVHDLPMEIQEIARTQGKPAAAKRVAGLVTSALVVNFVANCIIKGITGREPVPFDGLGMLANYMATGYGMTKEEYMASLVDSGVEAVTGGRPLGTERPEGRFDTGKALKRGSEDILDNTPLVGNVTTLVGLSDGRLPLPQLGNEKVAKGLGDAATALGWTGASEEEREAASGRWAPTLGGGLIDLAGTWIPMGGQLKKTVQGGTTLWRGGDYAGWGEEEKLRYSVEQTPANWVRGLLFGKSALPETDRYYAEGARALTPEQTDAYEQLLEGGMERGTAYDAIQDLRGTQKTEETGKQLGQILALRALEATDTQKKVLYQGVITDSRGEAVAAAERAGISFDHYLDAHAEYLRLMAGDGNAATRATDFAHWMDGQNFSKQQYKALRESFKFYSQIPNQETAYEKLVAAGVSEETAYSMAGSLDGLEPKPGRETVSPAQKGLEIAQSRVPTAEKMAALSAVLTESLYKKVEQAVEARIDMAVFLAAYEAQSGVEGEKNRVGETIRLSADRNKKAAIDAATPGLSVQERRVLYKLLGISQSVWGYLPRG